MNTLIESFRKIRMIILDMDGVLTDGKLLMHPDGEWLRKMDIKDGYAIQAAVRSGLRIAVVTGSASEPVKKRMARLGVDDFWENVTSKALKVQEIMLLSGLFPEQVLFMGDDIPDLEVFPLVGVSACPADAAPELRERVDFISTANGGEGSVRDVIQRIMSVQGTWMLSPNIASI